MSNSWALVIVIVLTLIMVFRIVLNESDQQPRAVLIGKKDYDALQETMNLMMNGQIQATLSRKDDESVDLDEIIKEIDHE